MVVSERPVSPSFRGKRLRSPRSLGSVRSWVSGLCRRSNVRPQRKRQHEFLNVTFTASYQKCICWVLVAVGSGLRLACCFAPDHQANPIRSTHRPYIINNIRLRRDTPSATSYCNVIECNNTMLDAEVIMDEKPMDGVSSRLSLWADLHVI